MTTRAAGRLAAVQAAARAHNDLSIDPTRPIDPFDAINTLGLELQFRPMKELLGAIVPGDPAGVLINTERPASVQRYTAAHEIGHWYLDQAAFALDTEEHVEGHPHDAREQNAQLFASHFLMPLDLVYATAAHHRLRKGDTATALTVYEISRDMHVSYSAAVHHLANIRFISFGNRDQLLRSRPAQLKRLLTAGRPPTNPRGDVWTLGGDVTDVEVYVGDEVIITLPENPSTGYRWLDNDQLHPSKPRILPTGSPAKLSSRADAGVGGHAEVIPLAIQQESAHVLARVADRSAPAAPVSGEPPLVGGPTIRRLGYSAQEAGQESVDLAYARPFESERPIDRVTIRVTARAMPDVELRARRIQEFLDEEAAERNSPS
ncbi:protease inhibitor I42 family protein [Agromyces bauzanensis]|uniref:ImmA/IrrE family metallo-endopeptidase n=1 Tax=Agromyces bauzanensis TaxID=1308924 RepID=A0A917UVC0_9MICO|nr:protease inhibitor I42 family protein [Agromyces bauzanensis]GGJ87431.1 hypothetical protein GCM10011372_27410 [Agromyces bauzanensis]